MPPLTDKNPGNVVALPFSFGAPPGVQGPQPGPLAPGGQTGAQTLFLGALTADPDLFADGVSRVWLRSDLGQLRASIGTTIHTIAPVDVNALFSATAAVTVANTGSELTLVGAGAGSMALAANTLVVGRVIRLRQRGYLSTKASPVGNFTIKVKIGSVTVLSLTTTLGASLSNVAWEIDALITVYTAGATGTVFAQGWFRINNALAGIPNTAAATVNTTVANTIDVTAQWATADTSNTITATNLLLELIDTSGSGAAAGGGGVTDHALLSNVTADQHHAQAHTLASHSTKAHAELTGVGTDDHHLLVHPHLGVATGGLVAHSSLSGIGLNDHHAEDHAARHAEGGGSDLQGQAVRVGSLGVGAAAPAAGQAAIASNLAVGASILATAAAYAVNTQTDPLTARYGGFIDAAITRTAVNATAAGLTHTGAFMRATLAGAQPLAGLIGADLFARMDGTDVLTNMYGVRMAARLSSTGTITNLYGLSLQAQALAAGTISAMNSADFEILISAAATITNLYGMRLQANISGAPTIGTYRGLALPSIAGAGTNWAIASAGGDSHHLGSLHLGSTTAPLGRLQITGAGLVIGAPTGGDKGAGTVNVATDMFKNGTAYTNPDYALEHWATGRIERYAHKDGAAEYRGLPSLGEVEAYAREHFALPGFGQEAAGGVFEKGERLLLHVEQLYLHLFAMSTRVEALERKVSNAA